MHVWASQLRCGRSCAEVLLSLFKIQEGNIEKSSIVEFRRVYLNTGGLCSLTGGGMTFSLFCFLRKQLTFWCLKLSVIVNMRLVPQKARLSLSLRHNPTGLFYGTLFQGNSFEESQNGDVHKEGDG